MKGPDRDGLPQDKLLAIYGLGLAGEAGEVIEMLKKHIGHGTELNANALVK